MSPNRIPSPRLSFALTLGTMLALSACSTTKTVRPDPEALATEQRKAAAAEEALEELRDTLAGAQAALGPGTPGADPAAQRRAQAQLLQNAQNTVQETRQEVATQPDSEAKTAALVALEAVNTALARTRQALVEASDTALVSGAGLLVFANMHTTLDRALAAIDDAQAKLRTALGADPSETLRATLSQAQALLTTAQLSLMPQLRQELAQAAAAEEALEELRDTLAGAQAALGPGTPGADPAAQRRAQAQALQNAQNTVQEAQEELATQPDSAAKTATLEALGAVDTALARTREALAADMANMRTTLNRALVALDDAQAKLATALGADPSETLRATLSQARTLLTTAQVSLVPQLRRELETAAAAEEALEELRASLEEAQAALGPGTPGADPAAQRRAQAQALQNAQNTVQEAREELGAQPDSEAKTATLEALGAVDTALARTREAVEAEDMANMRTTLDRALAALDDAQAKLATALSADPSETLRATLSQARTLLTTAQLSLVPQLRQELETAEADAATQRTRADTYDPRVSLADALLPRAERDVPRGEAQSITRTPRTDIGETGWAKLDIETDPVPFATGKRIAAAGAGLVATDELPLRAITLREAGRHFTVAQSRNEGRTRIHGDDGTPTAYSNTDGEVESSLQLSADGATLKFGGEGVVYYDMQRQFNYFDNADDTTANEAPWWRYGPDGKLGDASASAGDAMTASHARDLGLEEASGTLTADQATALQGYVADNSGACWQEDLSLCGDWAHDDLTIAFGTPSQSPHGEAAYYWKVRAPYTQLQRDTGLPDRNHDGRPQDLGTYELWLSHYGGVDDKGTADDESDDTHRYLQYAAYGLFTFLDGVVHTPSFLRQHAFALGYDAFRDAENMRTTDVTNSIAATFTGHTMARQLITDGSTTHVVITGADVLRGDVTLNACIGGSGCTGAGAGIPTAANRISGLISGLEELRNDGVWVAVTYNTIPMREGDIAADGSFKGALDYPEKDPDALDPRFSPNTWHYESGVMGQGGASQYGGNLYGPRDDLEAAGWWYVQPDPRLATDPAVNIGGIIGSFGAKCTEGCSSN